MLRGYRSDRSRVHLHLSAVPVNMRHLKQKRESLKLNVTICFLQVCVCVCTHVCTRVCTRSGSAHSALVLGRGFVVTTGFSLCRVLLRVRMLYYLKQEVIGSQAQNVLDGVDSR